MKYRILIVEDNIMLAGQQKKRLEKSGYEAEITIDEPGARKLLKKESFDLVLSDVRLPEGAVYLCSNGCGRNGWISLSLS